MRTSSAREECRLAASNLVQHLRLVIGVLKRHDADLAAWERDVCPDSRPSYNKRPALVYDCIFARKKVRELHDWTIQFIRRLDNTSFVAGLSDADCKCLKAALHACVRDLQGIDTPQAIIVLLERYRREIT